MPIPDAHTRALMRDPADFSSAGSRPLRPYQASVARAIARSVVRGEGKTFTVMFARQMGKNEVSAQLEAYLLTVFADRGGTIIKAAPSFKPQIVNSILRLKETLDAQPLTQGRWRPAFGYMLSFGRATVQFLTADPHANVVGATASLLLEIDEAQDVDPDKYDRDFRPMASSTNATTVLYGTAWSEDSLLERMRLHNRSIDLADRGDPRDRLHHEYDWRTLGAINPSYRAFVETEIERLGESHPSIQTQYLLHTLSDAGRLFSEAQRAQLRGTHQRCPIPDPEKTYIAGIDIAGEDEQAEDAAARMLSPKRDSTVITIAEVSFTGSQPHLTVVDHIWWTGRDQVWQYDAISALWHSWNFAHVTIDASGIGSGLAAFLEARFPERAERFVFTQPSKSALAYTLLATINTGRIAVYGDDHSPEAKEFWLEIRACRYWLRAAEQLAWSVPPAEGHDDFVISLALVAQAASALIPPGAGALLRAPADTEARGW